MSIRIWVFPESSGIIPGIPGVFPGGTKVAIDEETGQVISIKQLQFTEHVQDEEMQLDQLVQDHIQHTTAEQLAE